MTAHELLLEKRYRAEGRIRVDAKITHGAPDGWFKPGNGKTEWFKDHECGPEMIVVPAGSFMMGSNDYDSERPLHKVTIAEPFAVGRFAVTFAEWDTAHAAGSVPHEPNDQGWGRADRPVIDVSWEDSLAYCSWLSDVTGETYRLLSEAEWEYVCRTTSVTDYWWGSEISTSRAKFVDNQMEVVPVNWFDSNSWGLHQVHGNVWEWVEDNWHDDYSDNPPIDGSVWQGGSASLRVLRGGSCNDIPEVLRSAFRLRGPPDNRKSYIGFRVARVISPLTA